MFRCATTIVIAVALPGCLAREHTQVRPENAQAEFANGKCGEPDWAIVTTKDGHTYRFFPPTKITATTIEGDDSSDGSWQEKHHVVPFSEVAKLERSQPKSCLSHILLDAAGGGIGR